MLGNTNETQITPTKIIFNPNTEAGTITIKEGLFAIKICEEDNQRLLQQSNPPTPPIINDFSSTHINVTCIV